MAKRIISNQNVTTNHTVDLSKIKGATLLSCEEVEACQKYIPEIEGDYLGYWYLRTPDEDNMIYYAAAQYVETGTDPDFFDDGPWDFEGTSGTGIRPAIIIEGLDAFCPAFEIGDTVEIGKWRLTVISSELILCNTFIDCGIFDEETNIYEDSAAKVTVDNWFENEIRPYLK